MINDAGKHEVKNGNFVMAERGGDSHQGHRIDAVRRWSGAARLMRYSTPSLSVLAYNEIPENRRIRVVAAVGR